MKTFHRLCLVALLALVPSSRIYASCDNYKAFVRIESSQAAQFASLFSVFSSMPLTGTVVETSGAASIVEVAIVPAYADTNHLDAFDVAKKVKEVVTSGSWQVSKVGACIRFPPGVVRL